jgi:hypothetical protein
VKPDSDPPSSTALVLRAPNASSPSDDVELQKLWLSMTRCDWQSLAVIGGSKGLATLDVANLMAQIAWWYRGSSSCVFDFRDLGLRLLEYQLHEVNAQVRDGHRAILALRSIFENPTAIPLAKAVDGVILCVGLGKTRMAQAEKTVDEIGRERFIGTIILDPKARKTGGQ